MLRKARPNILLLDVGLEDENCLRLAETVQREMTGTLFSQIARVAVGRSGEAAALEAVRMTTREREVIANISVGMSNKEIAQEMNIATDTVKSHVRNVMDKLALHSRLQIAAYAHQQAE